MIRFSNADVSLTLRYRTTIKEILQELFVREGSALHSLQYVFCSDAYLLKINEEFLHHDDYTDIITFELADKGSRDGVEGEIYISLDRVKENAAGLGVTVQEELLRVIFHGALHLCGFKDKTRFQKKQMRAKEDEYLALSRERLP
jgi:probable rRNA maturation factor